MHLFHPPQVVDPVGLAQRCQELIGTNPHFSQWDYQLYTSINASVEPGTPPSIGYLVGKVNEEVAENLEALTDPDPTQAIYEFGDASWCTHALASSLDVNMAYYTARFFDWTGAKVTYRHPVARTATLTSIDRSDAPLKHEPMRLILAPGRSRSWDRPLPAGGVHLEDHLASNLERAAWAARHLTHRSDTMPNESYHAARNELGYALSDTWLCLGAATQRRVGRPIVVEALSKNVAKVNRRIANKYDFSRSDRR